MSLLSERREDTGQRRRTTSEARRAIVPSRSSRCRPAGGFTLIELLVVIAIIAILAAILLPVFAAAREHARRSSCTSNLQAISQALSTYRQDQGGYPPGLWDPNVVDGSANTQPYQSWTAGLLLLLGKNSPWLTTPQLSAGEAPYRLQLGRTPVYLASIRDLHCPDNPNSDPRDIATQAGDATKAYPEGYDNYDGPDPFALQSIPPSSPQSLVQTYLYSRQRLTPDDFGSPAGGSPGHDYQNADFTRQLKFSEPDPDTVVTWCDQHRPGGVTGGVSIPTPPSTGKSELVLFLDGKVMYKHYMPFSVDTSSSVNPQPVQGMGLIGEKSP